MSEAYEVNGTRVERGERGFTRLPVAPMLVGAELSIPLHIVHGAQEGPTLLLISGIHGPEHFVIRIVREIVLGLDPTELSGTVLAIPVANPVAFARSKRSTPEEDIDFANMNRIFPGRRDRPAFGGGASHPSDRTLTEWMAHTISEEVFPRVQYLIDFHCHMQGAALVESIVKVDEDGHVNQESFQMNRLLNLGVMHQSRSIPSGTATGYANQMGIVTAVAEVGGGGLSGPVQKKALNLGAIGVLNTFRYLDLLPGEPQPPGRQLFGTIQPHVRPTKAGYLLSEFEPDDLFDRTPPGIPVSEGDSLGVVFDPYTFEEVERLVVPVDGLLYLCRTSGPVEAGSHAYAVTAYEGAEWVD